MLNLWIGLCRGVPGLPKQLRDLGYKDRWIDWKFANQDLEEVSPDLILSSERINHTLLLEFKSGANTDPDQLRRYSRVTQNDIMNKAFISRTAVQSHDVALVGQSEYGERLCIGISEGGYIFPLVLADNEGLFLSYNQFQEPKVTNVFSSKLNINWPRVPTRFIPLNNDSAPWEIAEVVIPKILEYMNERRPFVSVRDICIGICNNWSSMGRQPKGEIESKVQDVLIRAARGHFKEYLRWIRNGVEIVANPLNFDTDKRTVVYRKLRTAQKNFIKSLRTGREQLRLPFSS